jgi:thioredoxin 1
MNEKDKCVLVNSSHDLNEILKTRDRVIALLYASWCPFCSRFLPIFKKQAQEAGQHFVMVQDDREAIADLYSIKIFPTVLFFENGVVSKRLDGVSGVGLDDKQLVEFVESCPTVQR